MTDAPLRSLVRARAAGRCEYCRLPEELAERPFHVEHIVARQHGGFSDPSNLALACDRCNLYKGPNLAGIDPADNQIVPLFHPRNDNWAEHFYFLGALIQGKSPTGRATAALLQMNAPPRVHLRLVALRSGNFSDLFA